MRDQRLAALGQGRTEPAQLATEALNRHLSPYSKDDPRYNGTPEEQIAEIKQVTLADVQKFHDQFYGASHGEFAVVGPIDPAAVQKAAADLLGNWNASAPYQPLLAAYKKAEALSRKIETPDKANAQFEAGLRLQMTETDPDYPAMVLANYMFGGSITARMPDRIRNREGLSYSVSSRFTVPSEGDAALFAASAISNPANTPKVEASFRDELARTLRDGFRADEVTAARKAYLDARLVARSQDQALLTLLASHEQLGRTMKWDEDLERKIQALTPDAINAAFRRHIDPVAISIVKAGDFKTAGAYQ
jgi:zinc protease